MSNVYHPAYRRGTILKSNVRLDRHQALQVADAVEKNAASFVNEALAACQTGAQELQKFEVSDAPASVRIYPTIVIDLPTAQIWSGDCQYEVRSCLTVCVQDRQSKIWTRISPMALGEKVNIEEYFDLAEFITSQSNKAITSKYADVISATVESDAKLEEAYRLVIRTAAVDDANVDNYFRDVFERGRNEEEYSDVAKNIEEALHSLDPDLRSLPKVGETGEPSDDGQLVQKIGIACPRFSVNEGILFDTHLVKGVFGLAYNDAEARFVGIGYDPLIGSVGSKQSLSHVIAGQVAREYGELY